MLQNVSNLLLKKFPCRQTEIKTLLQLLGNADIALPEALYVYGLSGTGKTALIKEFLLQSSQNNDQLKTVLINCIECYTSRILYENILEQLDLCDSLRCDNLQDFVQNLRNLHEQDVQPSILIALDNAERLRDMDVNILPTLLRLQHLCGLNLCIILISQLSFDKYHLKTGLPELLQLHFTAYNKAETLQILSADFEMIRAQQPFQDISFDFYHNYLNVFLSVFYKACRDVPELKLVSRQCLHIYVQPVLEGSIEANDVSRLWRHIAVPLRNALSQVYMRVEQQTTEQSQQQQQDVTNEQHTAEQSMRQLAQSLELPYYAKYLLIAAFLASHNSAKQDKRLFVKHHGKQRKRLQDVNAKAKLLEKMSTKLGPKSFSIDRLLAIFYAILDEKVGLTCNLLSQISTLVHLKLLSYISGEGNLMDGAARLQCTVSLDFILYIGKQVGFNVRQYLSDFM